MCNEKSIIPSKILSNWDWKEYEISFISHRYLNEAFKNGNQIKIEIYKNQSLYNLLPILLTCYDTKLKLHQLVKFVDNCRLFDNQIRTSLFARDEDFVESYTLQELKNLKKWINHYKKLIDELLTHVKECLICQARGHICEFCLLQDKEIKKKASEIEKRQKRSSRLLESDSLEGSPDSTLAEPSSNTEEASISSLDLSPIYNFNEGTKSCEDCYSVFHSSCWIENIEIRQLHCPKCERIYKRKYWVRLRLNVNSPMNKTV